MYMRNTETLTGEIKEGLNKWSDFPCSCVGKLYICYHRRPTLYRNHLLSSVMFSTLSYPQLTKVRKY